MSITKKIKIDLIILPKDQPRKEFARNSLEELAQSIGQVGLRQAILVRPSGKKFELVYGERRLRACKLLKAKTIKAEIEKLTDEEVKQIRLVENIQRESVHPLDEAASIAVLLESPNYSIERIADKIGKTKKYVAEIVQLNKLQPEVKKEYAGGKIELGHALLLAKMQPEAQTKLLAYMFNGFRVPTVAKTKTC
jgi:ParB family chromosome partitioning protein